MKLNEEMIRSIEEAIRRGMSNKKTCDLVGINEDTFYAWQKKYSEFSERIKKARAQKIQILLDHIRVAGMGRIKVKAVCPNKECGREFEHLVELPTKAWQALAWILERTEFDEFGLKQKVALEGKDGEAPILKVIYEKGDVRNPSA